MEMETGTETRQSLNLQNLQTSKILMLIGCLACAISYITPYLLMNIWSQQIINKFYAIGSTFGISLLLFGASFIKDRYAKVILKSVGTLFVVLCIMFTYNIFDEAIQTYYFILIPILCTGAVFITLLTRLLISRFK